MKPIQVAGVRNWTAKVVYVSGLIEASAGPIIYVCSSASHCRPMGLCLMQQGIESVVCLTDTRLGAFLYSGFSGHQTVFIATIDDLQHYNTKGSLNAASRLVLDDCDLLLDPAKSRKTVSCLSALLPDASATVFVPTGWDMSLLLGWLGTVRPTTAVELEKAPARAEVSRGTLIIVKTRAGCERCAKQAARTAQGGDNRERIMSTLSNFPTWIKETCAFKKIADLAEEGVGYFHSGMYPFAREMVQLMFANGTIHTVYSTVSKSIGLSLKPSKIQFKGDVATSMPPLDNLRLFAQLNIPIRHNLDRTPCSSVPSLVLPASWIISSLYCPRHLDDLGQSMVETYDQYTVCEAIRRLDAKGDKRGSHIARWVQEKEPLEKMVASLEDGAILKTSKTGMVSLSESGEILPPNTVL